jgi:UPF0755 protein
MRILLKFFAYVIAILFLAGSSLGVGTYVLLKWSREPFGTEAAEVEIEVPKGVTLAELSQKLESVNLVSSSTKFRMWTKVFSKFTNFKAGVYKIPSPISPESLGLKFIEGSTYREVKYEILLPEGFTLDSVIERCIGMGIGSREEFLRLSKDREFLDTLGIGADSIEGFLYPATYFFYEMPSEEDVYKELVGTFWKKLPAGYESMAASRGVTMYQAIIMASLIEAETMYEEEKPLIAEVIWNRLRMGMPLGIDASTIYGISGFDGNLTKDNLKDTSNPYNLRVVKGLPPTPINSPTVSSLKALLEPTSEGYLYYVLTSKNDKHHTFTKSLSEHNSAVAKFLAQ